MKSALQSFRSSLAITCAAAVCAAGLHAQASGIVLDAVTNQPVVGAIVTVQLTSTRTTTDASGLFNFPALQGPATLVAAAKGYFNQGTAVTTPVGGVLIALEPVIVGNNPNYQFLSPSTCSNCHGTQWEQWNNSPMGLTATNEWVHDLFSGTATPGGMNGFVYQRDSAQAAARPNGSCAACHQPEVWVKNPGAALEPLSGMSVNAMHGVSCETCHKIANIDSNFLNSHGPTAPSVLFNLPNDPINVHQVEYGVLGDVTFRIDGLMRASYQPQLVAEACAACHQYNNDHDLDYDFEEPGSPEGQATYEEWLNSPYGDPQSPLFATCVDCHMPAYGSTEVCGLGLPPRPTSQPRQHNIVGTTPEFLENAVDLALTVTDNGSSLAVQVDITNTNAGHKVPTGVSPRNMVLVVDAWRQVDGQPLAHMGSQTVDQFGGVGPAIFGNYSGVPGKMFAKINDDAFGNAAPLFTEAQTLRYDTRIAPLATDTTYYTFAVPPSAGNVKVRARLIYRRAFKALVDAKGWTQTGRGDFLWDITPPNYGFLMEKSEWASPGTPADITRYGAGCNGLSIDVIGGGPNVGNEMFGFSLSGAPASRGAVLAIGTSDSMAGPWTLPYDLAPLGAAGCFLLTSIEAQLPATTDLNGEALAALPLPIGVPPGIRFFAQWLVSDVANPLGLSLSDAMAVITQP